jgi:hypothetical protein
MELMLATEPTSDHLLIHHPTNQQQGRTSNGATVMQANEHIVAKS